MYLMYKYLDASGLPLLVRLMIIMGFFGFLELLCRVLTMLGIPVRCARRPPRHASTDPAPMVGEGSARMQRLTLVLVALMLGGSVLLGGCCPTPGCPAPPFDWNPLPSTGGGSD